MSAIPVQSLTYALESLERDIRFGSDKYTVIEMAEFKQLVLWIKEELKKANGIV